MGVGCTEMGVGLSKSKQSFAKEFSKPGAHKHDDTQLLKTKNRERHSLLLYLPHPEPGTLIYAETVAPG